MKVRAIVAGAFMLASAGAANAAITVFTNFGDWFTAVSAISGPITTETFQGNVITSSLSFSTTGAAHGTLGTNRFNDVVNRTTRSTTFSFGGNQNAFGGFFDLRPGGPGQGLQLSLLGGQSGTGLDVSPEIARTFSGGFFGLLSTDNFSNVRITGGTQNGGQETYNLDNVSFAAAGIPEPGTWLMMIVGFAGLAYAAGRRRISAKA